MSVVYKLLHTSAAGLRWLPAQDKLMTLSMPFVDLVPNDLIINSFNLPNP